MYKKNQNHQFSLGDFNQPMGLKLDPENKWIKKAAMIPWDEIELQYIRRDRNYIDWFMSYGYYPDKHQMERIAVIDKVYEQQE